MAKNRQRFQPLTKDSEMSEDQKEVFEDVAGEEASNEVDNLTPAEQSEPTAPAAPTEAQAPAEDPVATEQPVAQASGELNDWPSVRTSALSVTGNSAYVTELFEALERFQHRLGQNSRYGNPTYHEEGARFSQEMLRDVIRAFSRMDRSHMPVAYRAMVEFVRHNSHRFDAFHPAAVFRFQPMWPGSATEARGFELLVTLLHATVTDDFAGCQKQGLETVRILSVFPDHVRDVLLTQYTV